MGVRKSDGAGFRARIAGAAKLLAREDALSLPEFADAACEKLGGIVPAEYLEALMLNDAARFIHVAPGARADVDVSVGGKPSGGIATFFIFGKGSSAAVFFKTEFSSDSDECIGLFLGEGAGAQFCSLRKNGGRAHAKACMVARLGGGSSLAFVNSNVGSGSVEERFLFLQEGRKSRCGHYDASLAKNGQAIRKESSHFHLAPGTYSRSVFKYAALGKSRVEADCKVTIRQEASESDAHLLARGLLLSQNSSCNVAPQLSVHNCDVSAGHGSSVSPLDAEALFYLSARGVGEEESRLLMLEGFLRDLVQKSGVGHRLASPLGKELSSAARAALLGDRPAKV